MEQFWNLAHKINEISINIFEELYVTFLDYMLWKKARHDQIYWVCTAHLALLKYTSMVRSCDGFEPLFESQAIREKNHVLLDQRQLFSNTGLYLRLSSNKNVWRKLCLF